MNLCVFSGNLTHDPELKNLANGTSVVNFRIATSGRRYKKSDGSYGKDVVYLDFEAWDSGAETINKYFKKGDPILVHAIARMDRWENEKGEKRTAIKFRVTQFDFINGKKQREEEPVQASSGQKMDEVTDDVPF